MAYDTLILEREGAVGIITLNRPPVNAINYAAITNLGRAVQELEKDEGIRAIVITGAGERAFSAGFDLTSFADPRNNWMTRVGHIICNRIERCSKPVVAAINGLALGGGFEILMACHFRIMVDSENAVLGLPEISLGIIPSWGATQRLPRLIGRTRALEVAITGKRLHAAEAYEWGLLNKVSMQGDVLNDARVYAKHLSKLPPLAMASILNAMILGSYTNIYAGFEMELQGADIVNTSEDAMEGMASWLEKREPRFTGK